MNVKLEVVTLNSCNPLPYAQALKQQFALCETGRVGFALFVSAPVVTLGMRAGLDQLKKDKAYLRGALGTSANRSGGVGDLPWSRPSGNLSLWFARLLHGRFPQCERFRLPHKSIAEGVDRKT